jgi:hypothetical protein
MVLTVARPKRVALVIGNAGYVQANKLANPVNDARVFALKLRALGFIVEGGADASGAGIDLGRADMSQSFDTFLQKLAPGDVALIFYAGHGLQVDDENYLVPTDARLDSEHPVKEFIPVRPWIEHVARAVGRRGTSIVFLDACREEPFSPEQVRRLAERPPEARPDETGPQVYGGIKPGFATVRVKAGDQASPTFIVFATAPGDFAYDGEGGHSPFSAALLQHLDTRGLPIDELFKRVCVDVQRQTETKKIIQDPWRETNLDRDFYFKKRTWRPLLELGLLGFIAGLITCALLFWRGRIDGFWAIGLIYACVAGFGVWRWGSGRPGNVLVAVASSTLAFSVALFLLETLVVPGSTYRPPFEAGLPSWNEFRTGVLNLQILSKLVSDPPTVATTFITLLAGIVLALGTALGCKPQGSVFRGFSAAAGATMVGLFTGAFFVAFVALRTGHPEADRALLVGLGALWYAILGASLGYCLVYYVPEHRPSRTPGP